MAPFPSWRRLAALATVAALGAVGAATLPAFGAPGDAYVFPVEQVADAKFGRPHHDYPAADIFAPCGHTFVAPTAGFVSQVSRIDLWDPAVNFGATRGGLSVTVIGDDGVRYYGSHLRTIAEGIRTGVRVQPGRALGEIGDTGSARGTGCHLHFGISPQCDIPGDWWIRRGVFAPWPYLEAWQRSEQWRPDAAVRRFRDAADSCLLLRPAG